MTIKDSLQHLIIHHYNYDLQVYVYTTGLYSLLCILLPAQLYHRMEVIFFISFSNKKKVKNNSLNSNSNILHNLKIRHMTRIGVCFFKDIKTSHKMLLFSPEHVRYISLHSLPKSKSWAQYDV